MYFLLRKQLKVVKFNSLHQGLTLSGNLFSETSGLWDFGTIGQCEFRPMDMGLLDIGTLGQRDIVIMGHWDNGTMGLGTMGLWDHWP